jgi:hypothetical protein
MVGHPLVPPGQRSASRILEDRLLVVVTGETADRGDIGEPGNGGEHDLKTVIVPQQPRAEEAAHRSKVTAHLRLVVTLVVVGAFWRRPSVPHPRDHAAHYRASAIAGRKLAAAR